MKPKALVGTALLLLLGHVCWAQTAALPATPSIVDKRELAPGVEYRHILSTTPSGEPWSIHVIEVSRNERSIRIRAAAGVSPTSPREMARELPTGIAADQIGACHHVLAVVNGDYDAMPYLGVSLGPSVTSRELWTAGGKSTWPAFAFTTHGEPVLGAPKFSAELRAGHKTIHISTFNKSLALSPGLALYSRAFRGTLKSDKPFQAVILKSVVPALPISLGTTIHAEVRENIENTSEVSIPTDGLVLVNPVPSEPTLSQLSPGQKLSLKIHLRVGTKKAPTDVIGGFPIVVHNGHRDIIGNPSPSHSKRHPRTAVCYNETSVIFAVVDGRQPKLSVGMTLQELGDLMVSLGCTEAINTDGGGSSVMATVTQTAGSHLQIVNSPSDGKERGRGNAWIIESEPTKTAP